MGQSEKIQGADGRRLGPVAGGRRRFWHRPGHRRGTGDRNGRRFSDLPGELAGRECVPVALERLGAAFPTDGRQAALARYTQTGDCSHSATDGPVARAVGHYIQAAHYGIRRTWQAQR